MSEHEQGRLWVRLIRRHRVERDALIACDREDPEAALQELLPTMDLSQPVWMERNRLDWEEYGLTRFLPEHFLESVSFDSMELSYIAP